LTASDEVRECVRMDNDQEDPRFSSELPAEPPDDIELEGYLLQREISRGGQAIIFSAIKKSTGRKVAVKFFPGGSFATRKEKVRMDREVRVLAALDHPNIVSVIDRGQTADGSTYFVLEYVRGKTLAEYIDDLWEAQGAAKTADEIKTLLQLFVRICDAVNAAHLRGVVHRDLKPSNIIIDSYGEPHILDFGVALSAVPLMDEGGEPLPSVTWTGEFLGSVQWASPEQAEGDQSRVDVRSDVYSLGIILYEALTGDFPYDVFGTLPNVLKNIMSARPEPPSQSYLDRFRDQDGVGDAEESCPIDPVLDGIVLRALEKKREDRFQTAGELSKALSTYLAGHTVSLRRPLIRRNPWLRVGGTVLAALVLAGTVFWGTKWYVERDVLPVADIGGAVPYLPRASAIFGYRIDGEHVVFEFDARDYNRVRLANGALGQVSDIGSVSRVAVAGPFNEWEPLDPDWQMERVLNRFELKVPLGEFSGRYQWPFKFVVNDQIWVSAPLTADNKEVVVEDTATYNLIFTNPNERESPDVQALRTYRQQISRIWPGAGEHLVRDELGLLHLSLTAIDGGTRIQSLQALRGIPLSSLNLGEMRVSDMDVLAEMDTLRWLVCNDATFGMLFFGMQRELRAGDVAAAYAEAESALAVFRDVPVFGRTRTLLLTSLRAMQELQAEPGRIPEAARPFGGRHYALILEPKTWAEARQFAEQHGATLATIHTDEQQEWMTEQFGWPTLGRNLWIGGTDELVRGSWGWLSGVAWRYEHWAANYPDGDEQARAAAMKYDGWWVNLNGEQHQLPFLIEWAPGPAE
jgi:serine/threonine protein kinase